MKKQDLEYLLETLNYGLNNCDDSNSNTETHFNSFANAINLVQDELNIHNVRGMLIAKHERKIDELNKSHQNICEGGTNLVVGSEKWNNELMLIEGKIAGIRLAINYL